MPDTTSPALNTSASPALSPGIDPALMQPLDAEARRSLMRGGSKTFFAASLLLPSRVREPATALYAYCRLADDAVDMGEDPHAAGRALTQRLDAIYEGRPGPVEVDRALAQVVHRYAIPRSLPDALLEGFLWDAQGRRYHTLSDVQAYGARVAGAVGAMMALVMETRGPQAVARACELGVAMQLTNIARDVGEDARNGRLYLPRDWLAEAGVDADAWMRAPVFTPAIGSVVQRLLRAADVLYERAAAGIADLPLDCRPAIQAACRVYAEIGHQLEREGLDSVSRRAVVSKGRKIALLAASTGAALMHSPFGRKPLAPLPEIAYLVEAVQQCEARPASSAPRRSFDQRMEWATDLYARLIDREQQRSQGRQSRA
jgi:phytoene synthase